MEMVRGFSFAVASSRENDVVEDILEVALNEASMVISDDFVMVMEEGERCVCVCARVCVCQRQNQSIIPFWRRHF